MHVNMFVASTLSFHRNIRSDRESFGITMSCLALGLDYE